jgi:ATP-dependent HslUV protease ATP-binding subunit HslU
MVGAAAGGADARLAELSGEEPPSPLCGESMTTLTPREIVSELDRYIIGQKDAKRAVAVAMRNRWRRKQLGDDLRDEVYPKNILMIGPTGVGKTEISRRLAKLAKAPFLKVEATKFTEVGYVGRDVDSIIRDLVDAAIVETRAQMRDEVKAKAHRAAEERVIEALAGKDAREQTREMFRGKLKRGELDATMIELDIAEPAPAMPMLGGMPGMEQQMQGLQDLFGKAFGGRKVRRRLTVAESYDLLIGEEADKLLDDETVTKAALAAVQDGGIVFIDEIDKVCARAETRGADVSREGVQRDLLPLIEGTTVSTKYGPVKTDHILFIASGAFHVAKPSDLLPELQGRLPIRVELQPLTEGDFVRILTETDNALTLQYSALMETEDVKVGFTDDGIAALARIAAEVNASVENIGARRLYTVMERVFEELSFTAPDRPGESVLVDADFVEKNIGALSRSADLSRYVL